MIHIRSVFRFTKSVIVYQNCYTEIEKYFKYHHTNTELPKHITAVQCFFITIAISHFVFFFHHYRSSAFHSPPECILFPIYFQVPFFCYNEFNKKFFSSVGGQYSLGEIPAKSAETKPVSGSENAAELKNSAVSQSSAPPAGLHNGYIR